MSTVMTNLPPFSNDEAPALKASERVRRRLIESRTRFHANDNIAGFVRDGELAEIKSEVEHHFRSLLRAMVVDVEGDHNTAETARRVAKMYVDEVFRGRFVAAPAITDFPNVENVDELMIVGPISVRSACSHHFCPIVGRVWIGVLPNEYSRLIGLSKYARICDWIMSRPQIQEEAVVMLAAELERIVKPNGLAIIMKADHFCMHWRGVKDNQTRMTSSVMKGSFLQDPTLRREFLSLLPCD